MALQSIVSININDHTYTNFKNLTISQAVNDHHQFEVTFRWDDLGQADQSLFEKCQELIGSPLDIIIEPSDASMQVTEGVFSGIITNTLSGKSDFTGAGSEIILKGYSPTILMDHGPHCTSFEEYTPGDIIREATSPFQGSLAEIVINPVGKNPLPYTVQYNESSFDFMRRLATRLGEWFYYNGQKLVFGTNSEPTIAMKYGIDLKDFNLNMALTPKTFKYTTREYSTDELVAESCESGTTLGGFNATTSDKSEQLFTNEALANYNQLAPENSTLQELQEAMDRQKEAHVSRMIRLSGRSTNPALAPGKVISISATTADGDTDYGEYMVTTITHKCISAGNYENNFEALPLEVVIPPYTNVMASPRCNTQTAKVTDNNDPLGMGRVRVQFNWQTNAMSPWLRVSLPHTGADKGMYFVPEVEDEVVVEFEGGNAEKPFVAGCLYHGNAKPDSFVNETNDIKAIRTRGGHTIQFTDTEGEEKIEIFDNEGSIIIFDTQAKSLTINSTENIEISAKNISISAEENIKIGAQGNIEVAAEGDLSNMANGNLALQSAGDTTLASDGGITIEATADTSLTGQNISAEGKVKAGMVGTQVTIEGQMTAVQGATGKMEVI
ncbi:hypothetical protein DMA11_01875 [Marinilabiliaceae bacterium JC017]|nr:hypothetical protein DMA11_01875 [Marinilabiliaceae bacterium JC017]